MQRVRERRVLRDGLSGETAQPRYALTGGVADGRPERPTIWRGLDGKLILAHRRDDIAEALVMPGPHAVGGADGHGYCQSGLMSAILGDGCLYACTKDLELLARP